MSADAAGPGPVLAVVVGRAGSRGLPGKNARPLGGRPMVAWTIDDARRADTVDRVVVSTDGADIAAATRAAGADVVDRPAALATDDAPVVAAVRHAVETLSSEAAVVVVLYANVPVRPPGLVDEAVRVLRASGADSVQSYVPVGKHHPAWMVRLDDAGRVETDAPAPDRRQDLPPLFLPDGGVIAVTRGSLLGRGDHPHDFLGRDRRGIVTEPGAVVDVDTAADLEVAAARLRARLAGAGS
ncbi:MAG: acylneuraminate cytidylyltransferase family protein [Planctomycetota bacterium]